MKRNEILFTNIKNNECSDEYFSINICQKKHKKKHNKNIISLAAANNISYKIKSISNILDFDIDWNGLLLSGITFGLSKIPHVGGILSSIVKIIWPTNKPSVFDQVKDEVEKLIFQAGFNAYYTNLQNTLAGLQNLVLDYIITVNDSFSDNEINSSLGNAYSAFLANICSFCNLPAIFGLTTKCTPTGYENSMLLLFGQFANLHLLITRDACIRGIKPISTLKSFISAYVDYANSTYATFLSTIPTSNFNNYISFVSKMQQGLLNYAKIWPYLDFSIYGREYVIDIPKVFRNDSIIYFTATQFRPPAVPGFTYFDLISITVPNSRLKRIDASGSVDPYTYSGIISFASNYENGDIIAGGVKFSSSLGKQKFYIIDILPDNPIKKVSAVIHPNINGVFATDFVFEDGNTLGYFIPSYRDGAIVVPNNTFQQFIAPENPNYNLVLIIASSNRTSFGQTTDLLMGFKVGDNFINLLETIL